MDTAAITSPPPEDLLLNWSTASEPIPSAGSAEDPDDLLLNWGLPGAAVSGDSPSDDLLLNWPSAENADDLLSNWPGGETPSEYVPLPEGLGFRPTYEVPSPSAPPEPTPSAPAPGESVSADRSAEKNFSSVVRGLAKNILLPAAAGGTLGVALGSVWPEGSTFLFATVPIATIIAKLAHRNEWTKATAVALSGFDQWIKDVHHSSNETWFQKMKLFDKLMTSSDFFDRHVSYEMALSFMGGGLIGTVLGDTARDMIVDRFNPKPQVPAPGPPEVRSETPGEIKTPPLTPPVGFGETPPSHDTPPGGGLLPPVGLGEGEASIKFMDLIKGGLGTTTSNPDGTTTVTARDGTSYILNPDGSLTFNVSPNGSYASIAKQLAHSIADKAGGFTPKGESWLTDAITDKIKEQGTSVQPGTFTIKAEFLNRIPDFMQSQLTRLTEFFKIHPGAETPYNPSNADKGILEKIAAP